VIGVESGRFESCWTDRTSEEVPVVRTEDATQGTVGWFVWGTGTVGIAKGQTLRLSFVNLGSINSHVLCGVFQNPRLVEDSFTLQPGESKHCDVKAADIPKALFDKTGRVQVRAFVKSSARTVRANLEVFDSQTGRTSVVLPLQELDGCPPT
jgi:hypothetical protein